MGARDQPPSKFALSDLTMRSMIELERFRAGLDYETAVLFELSSALMVSGYEDSSGAASFAFIEPSLYEPYDRIVRDQGAVGQSTVVRIRTYIRHMSDELSLVANGDVGPVESLIPACTRLHRELVQEINSEVAFDVNDWPSVYENPSASVRAA